MKQSQYANVMSMLWLVVFVVIINTINEGWTGIIDFALAVAALLAAWMWERAAKEAEKAEAEIEG